MLFTSKPPTLKLYAVKYLLFSLYPMLGLGSWACILNRTKHSLPFFLTTASYIVDLQFISLSLSPSLFLSPQFQFAWKILFLHPPRPFHSYRNDLHLSSRRWLCSQSAVPGWPESYLTATDDDYVHRLYRCSRSYLTAADNDYCMFTIYCTWKTTALPHGCRGLLCSPSAWMTTVLPRSCRGWPRSYLAVAEDDPGQPEARPLQLLLEELQVGFGPHLARWSVSVSKFMSRSDICPVQWNTELNMSRTFLSQFPWTFVPSSSSSFSPYFIRYFLLL